MTDEDKFAKYNVLTKSSKRPLPSMVFSDSSQLVFLEENSSPSGEEMQDEQDVFQLNLLDETQSGIFAIYRCTNETRPESIDACCALRNT